MGYKADIFGCDWYELERHFDEHAESEIKQQRKERRI